LATFPEMPRSFFFALRAAFVFRLPSSSRRIALSRSEEAKCMYRSVTASELCPASRMMANAGAPRIARCEQKVCLRT